MSLHKICKTTEILYWDKGWYTRCPHRELHIVSKISSDVALDVWSFLLNVPFMAVKLVGQHQAFIFNYNKPCPILKGIITF